MATNSETEGGAPSDINRLTARCPAEDERMSEALQIVAALSVYAGVFYFMWSMQ